MEQATGKAEDEGSKFKDDEEKAQEKVVKQQDGLSSDVGRSQDNDKAAQLDLVSALDMNVDQVGQETGSKIVGVAGNLQKESMEIAKTPSSNAALATQAMTGVVSEEARKADQLKEVAKDS